ncbi:MAG TPA: CPBP family intramembrane metalloprotease [Myxococcota bacterium]|nr:CPBP family intramembrane metalloprotease [Myxococcota bacterium]HOA14279.1 CPBP family intramembrane metalloprotease [Myxococcota bacterium]HOC99532.1 CPBP family intramembrane metalloprotease [Myxococcota bacterium]HOH77650.1 CPBP family intramembrane metalloprotease [Myxococcota bacterium]HPV03463.1 CPBP family intramembrane metalloprotease [Myxococcota bacterium]
MNASKNAMLAGGAIFVIAAAIFVETIEPEPLPVETTNTIELRQALFLAGSLPSGNSGILPADQPAPYDSIATGMLEELAGRSFMTDSDGLTAAAASVALGARHTAMLFAAPHAGSVPGAMSIVRWAADPSFTPSMTDLQAIRAMNCRQWARDRAVTRIFKPQFPNLPEETREGNRSAILSAAATVAMLAGISVLIWGIVCWSRWRRRQFAEVLGAREREPAAESPLTGLFSTYIWFTAWFLAVGLLLPQWLQFFNLSAPVMSIIVYSVTGGGGLIIAAWFGRSPSENDWKSALGFTSTLPPPPAAFPRKGSLRAALDGYSMVWPIVIVATLIGSFIGDTGSGLDNPVSLFLITEKDISGRVLLVLSAVILAPIFEEPVFRGLFYRRLRVILSPYGAAAASGFIFAAAHFPASGFLQLWAIGFTLGLAYEYSGSLKSSMIVHGLWNLGTSISILSLFN